MNRKGTKDPSVGKVYPTGTRTLLYDSISSPSTLSSELLKSFLTRRWEVPFLGAKRQVGDESRQPQQSKFSEKVYIL